jgi:SAM-dependent methyltransferase
MSHNCRFCGKKLEHLLADLGMSPLANAFLESDQLNKMEPFYPLIVYVCDSCFLVQLEEFSMPEQIFSEYFYFSSYSETWLEHVRDFAANIVSRLGLTSSSLIVEVASNDGYLLQYIKDKGPHVLGIEPARNVAQEAVRKGIPTIIDFFGTKLARQLLSEGKEADLLIANNVLAHVPDLNDFVSGLRILLKPQGIITIEFPHLMKLLERTQFDTIYHEHFSYFSFTTVETIFEHHGLVLFDVEELTTHGGSIRVYAGHSNNNHREITDRVVDMKEKEKKAGLHTLDTYISFPQKIRRIKNDLLEFLISARKSGKKIVGYGAPAKGNTLLNYCGIRNDFIEYTVDRNPHKQGHYLPGTHIPILSPERILITKPDFILVLPWNIKEEIVSQMSFIRQWGGKFVTPIPRLQVIE